jgi:ribosome-binding factor A
VDFHRSQRVAEVLHQEISSLIQFELKDPRLGFVTITGVEVTSDIQHAKVFFTVVGDEAERKSSTKALESSGRFLRKQLGSRIHLRSIPELTFHYDQSIEYGNRIESLLREINQDQDNAAED